MAGADAALVGQLALLLSKLEQHMRAQAKAAQEVAQLVSDAERLAHKARALASGDRRSKAAAAKEVRDKLDAFLAEVAVVASTAIEVARINEMLAERLSGHCGRLQVIGGLEDAAGRRNELRTEVGRMAKTIEAMQVGQQAADKLGEQVSALAKAAAGLAVFGDQLEEERLPAAEVGIALSRGLRNFADQAGALASAMAQHAASARKAVMSTAAHTNALATGGAPADAAKPPSIDRVGQVVRHGEEVAERATQVWDRKETPRGVYQW